MLATYILIEFSASGYLKSVLVYGGTSLIFVAVEKVLFAWTILIVRFSAYTLLHIST